MRKTFHLGILTLLSLTSVAVAQQQQQILTPPGAQQPSGKIAPEASYGLGFDIGSQLAAGMFEASDISLEQFMQGFKDALGGKQPSIEKAKLEQAMQQLNMVMQQRMQQVQARRQAENVKFMADNKKRDGVIETDSGLQYEVLKSGSGASPSTDSQVTVHYEGRFTNGEIFDSSIRRGEPATFGVTQVIKGWTEALLSMKVGDKWRLFIPSDLAYGPQGRGNIPPNEPLIFEVELLSVQ